MATGVLGLTSVPAAGVELMTLPEGTVGLLAFVTAPSTRLAPVIAVVAAACVRPTTFGTATCAGPSETTSATAEPAETIEFATGFWLMTLPAGTLLLFADVVVPTTRPASAIVCEAPPKVSPVTSGTVTGASGPSDRSKLTRPPTTRTLPASGD